jgi:pimeloyl-ACP methyl ester carboxylesterase
MTVESARQGRTAVRWQPPAGQVRDAGLRVRVLGQGSPTVLLLHGLAGSHRYFGAKFDVFGQDGTLVVPDLLGFGKSPHPDDSDYGPDAHADAVLDALERIAAQPPIHVGAHSVGTLVALRIALRRPDWIGSVVAFAPPLYETPEQARAHIVRLGLWVRLFALDTPWARAVCGWMCRHRQTAARLVEWLRRDLPREIARDAVDHTWPSYSRSLRNLVLRAHGADDVSRLRVPLHLIAGTDDAVLDLGFLEELARSHGHVRLERWPGGHDLPLSDPDRCVDVLRSLALTGICGGASTPPRR